MTTGEVLAGHRSADIRIVEPRNALSPYEGYLLAVVGVAAGLMVLQFSQIGAWPISVFALIDASLLALAVYIFRTSRIQEERLRVAEGQVELLHQNRRGERRRVVLPALWTRLEIQSRSDLECDLWLVHRRQRYPIGRCASVDQRRRLIPLIRSALAP